MAANWSICTSSDAYTASCKFYKVITTLIQLDQSRDISLKSVNLRLSRLTLIAVVGVALPVLGKQMSDIRSAILVFRDSSDYILEPFSWFDSISFASCDERVDHRGSYSRCIAATEEIVLPIANGLMAFSTPLLSMFQLPFVTYRNSLGSLLNYRRSR